MYASVPHLKHMVFHKYHLMECTYHNGNQKMKLLDLNQEMELVKCFKLLILWEFIFFLTASSQNFIL